MLPAAKIAVLSGECVVSFIEKDHCVDMYDSVRYGASAEVQMFISECYMMITSSLYFNCL